MANTQFNPQYNPLLANIVNNRNWATGLAKLGRGFTKPLEVIDAMNPSGSFSVESPDGSMRVAFQPHQQVTQIIAGVSQSGANLIVTFVDPAYAGFRDKMIVMDSAGNQAYVVSNGLGTVTLAPATYPTTLSSSSHFTAGRSITDLGNAAGNQDSTGVANLYKTNDYRTNYSAIYRDSHQISSRDKFVSYKWNEAYYSYSTGEMDMVERFANYKVWNMIYSEGGQFNTPTEGVANRYYGIRASIREQGGRYVPMTSLFTTADFESDLDFLATTNPNQYQTYDWFGGRRAWARINTLYSGKITFTQSRAVINGNELNFDIPVATINGTTVRFHVWGVFDDIKKFPIISSVSGAGYMESNTYFMINTDPIPSMDGGTVPTIRKFHFGSSMVTGGAETLYRFIPGMVGPGMGNSTGGGMMNGYQMTASSIMGSQFEIAEDAGFDIQGDAGVYRHLVI